jgi:hypothetical protein
MGSAQRGSGLDTCGRLHHPERGFMPELGFCAPRDKPLRASLSSVATAEDKGGPPSIDGDR